MKKTSLRFSLFLLLVMPFGLMAQIYEGSIIDATNAQPVIGAVVEIMNTDQQAITNASGVYRFYDLEAGEYNLRIRSGGYTEQSQQIQISPENTTIQTFSLESSGEEKTVYGGLDINVISEAQLDQVEDDSQVSSLLTAGRDPFNNAAAFNMQAARFRVRGLDLAYNQTFLNGVPFNDLDDGRAFWAVWGGLNDVFRRRESMEGLRTSNFSFGGINGATNIDLRPSAQRKQIKAVYNLANFAYSHRVMLTYSTGLSQNGWAFSFSGSKRWAQEGYIEGTFYDAYGYFAAAEKRFNPQHAVTLTVFGAPSKRGRSTASTQEMYDISGDPFYNPNWGYLNGEKRNPRQFRVHMPVTMLRYDFNPTQNIKVVSSMAFMTGKNASTGIDWFDAPDPRPDYYRKLPSFQNNLDVANLVEAHLTEDKANRQLDLDAMYAANASNETRIENVDGIEGNDVTGKLASYLLNEDRFDQNKFAFNTVVNTVVNSYLNVNGGVQYIYDRNKYFRVVDDLMGADFSVNWDKFAPQQGIPNAIIDTLQQNDLNNPNQLIYEGDVYGYNYLINNQKLGTWGTAEFVFPKVDFFVGGQVNLLSYQRDGKYRNGAFPEQSFGLGEVNSFLTGMVKTGVTYKINGRNYLYANGAYGTEAPNSRNSYITPRTRHAIIPGLVNEKIFSGEAGYNARFPRFKARLTGYFNQINDQFESRNVYVDNVRQFGNVIQTNIDQRYMGVEFGSEYNLTSTLSGEFAIGHGQHFFTDRPNLSFAIDDTEEIRELGQVYINNYRVNSGPQTAATLGLEYRNPKFWSVSVNANYFDHNYLNVSPFRRYGGIANEPVVEYSNIISDLESTSSPAQNIDDLEAGFESIGVDINEIFQQERFDRAMTFDMYARKSWKRDGFYVVVSASVNNLTDNIFRSGGFEQLRTRFLIRDRDGDEMYSLDDLFPPRYYYAYGRSYFLTFSVSY